MNLPELKKLIQEEVEKSLTPHLEKIKPSDMDSVLDVGDKAFGTFMGHTKTMSKHPNYNFKKEADLNKSVKLVLGNLIIGYYLLSDKQTIQNFLDSIVTKHRLVVTIDNEELFEYSKHNRGIQGLTVGILPKYKGRGYSKLLFDYPKSTGYDYIWAVQTEGMSDLAGWLKRAELLLTMKSPGGEKFYITIEKF